MSAGPNRGTSWSRLRAVPRILVVDDNPELLALLSSSFEEAGYTVQTAHRGRAAIELAKRERPDLAVIDVLLPDVMGFEVGEALQRQKIPIIFMSGVHKGGKAAANAVARSGAVGYFEKPFERRALLAMVESQVPARPVRAKPAWDVEAAEGVDGPGDAMELTGRIDLTSGETQASIKGAPLNLRGAPLVTPAPPVLTPRPSSQPPSARPPAVYTAARTIPPGAVQARPSYEIEIEVPLVAPAPQAAPPTAALAPQADSVAPQAISVASQASGLQPSLPPPPPLDALLEIPQERGSVHRGAIDDNMPQLFATFLATKETGELGLSRGPVRKIVYFEKGMPVFALSNLVAERLGQFLVRAGKIDPETLKSAVEEANETSQRTGDVLILMGLLTEQERLYYVGQQIKSILYSLFAWTDGSYQLSFQDRARKEAIKLDIHPATLVLRGVKKLYKPERLARILSMDDRPIPGGDPLFSLSDVELQGWEALVVARCDGTRAVRELLRLSGKPELEALGMLVALVSMRILEVRRPG